MVNSISPSFWQKMAVFHFLFLTSFSLAGQDLGSLTLGLAGPDPGNMNVPWEEDGIAMRMLPYPGSGCTGPNCYSFDGTGIWIYPATLEVEIPTSAPIGQVEIDMTDWCGANCTEIRLTCASGLEIWALPNNPFSPETIVIPIPAGEIPVKLEIGGFEAYVDNIRFTHGSLSHIYSGPNYPSRTLNTHSSGKPFGVTADGSAVSTFRLRSLDSQWVLALSGANTDLDGKLTLVSSSLDGGKLYRYQHPKYMNEVSGAKRTIQLLVLDKVGGSMVASMPLDLWRCPVVLVHGLNSSSREFQPMVNYLVSSGKYQHRQIFTPDYFGTNKAAFRVNALVPLHQIYGAIASYRNAGIAMGRADLVGHSMGGLLARLSQLSPANKDNIRRIVSLNTPHSGTQLADYALDTTSHVRNFLCSAFSQIGFDLCNTPATNDLAVHSQAILSLNGSIPKIPVPVHAISTTWPVPPIVPESENQWNWEIKSGLSLPLMLGRFSLNLFYEGLFDGEHDGVVPTISQRGGLTGSAQQKVQDQFHVNSTQNQEVMQQVLTVLMADPTAAVFDPNGFDPPKLEYAGPPLPLAPSIPDGDARNDLQLTITSPLAGEKFHHGDKMEIQVEGSAEIDGLIFFMAQGAARLARKEMDGFQGTWNLDLDSTAMGTRLILVVGVDTMGNRYAVDSTWILVEPKIPIQGIAVHPDSLFLAKGASTNIQLEADLGTYHSEIFQMPGVMHSFSSGKAAWNETLGVQGNELGRDSLRVTLGNLKTSFIPIEIYPPDSVELPLWVVMEGTDPVCGKSTGAISVNPRDGMSPYSFIWSDGSTDSLRTDLPPGEYHVTVTDALGQVVRRNLTLKDLPGPELSSTVTNATCKSMNGRIELNAQAGSPPFSFLWGNGDTTSVIAGLAGGTFHVTVTDAAGCVVTDSILLEETPPLEVELIGQDPGCDESNGQVEVMVQVAEPLSFQWNTGDSTSILQGLPGGEYVVTVTDANQCIAVDTISLLDRVSPVFDLGPDTTLQIGETLVIGYPQEEPGWTFEWSTGQNTAQITVTDAGIYSLVVVTDVDCAQSDSIAVDYLSSALNELGIRDLVILPNPANGWFVVEWESIQNGPLTMRLLDLTGVTVLQQTWTTQGGKAQWLMDVQGMPSGFYTLVLEKDGLVFSKPLMISRD